MGSAPGATGGSVVFASISGSANFVINGGTNGGSGGTAAVSGDIDGSASRFQIFGDGVLNVGRLSSIPATVGSIEGDGLIYVAANGFTVGNDLSTTFSGVIGPAPNSGSFGSITKVGRGTLTLTGSNTYPDGTTIEEGVLSISNTIGSGTGAGPVLARVGTLGGLGTISGPVIIGDGRGAKARLTPSAGTYRPRSTYSQRRADLCLLWCLRFHPQNRASERRWSIGQWSDNPKRSPVHASGAG